MFARSILFALLIGFGAAVPARSIEPSSKAGAPSPEPAAETLASTGISTPAPGELPIPLDPASPPAPSADPPPAPDPEILKAEKKKALTAEIEGQLQPLALGHFRTRITEALVRIDTDRENNALLWGPSPDIDTIFNAAEAHLAEHAISPASLAREQYIAGLNATAGAERDRIFTAAVIHAGLLLRHGPIDVADFWTKWNAGDVPGAAADRTSFQDSIALLTASPGPDGADAFFRSCPSPNPLYGQLLATWKKARQLAGTAEWQPIPPLEREVIRPGESYRDLAHLEKRLAEEGFPVRIVRPALLGADAPAAPVVPTLTPAPAPAAGNAPSRHYTQAHADMVRKFQAARGLLDDGLLGANTLVALNLGPIDRARMLRVNLERARWLPGDLGTRFVFVNLPAGRLLARNADGSELGMRVVFGKNTEATHTPLFREVMETVVFRPYWNVPHSIVKEEILPEIYNDPGYFYRKGYEIVREFDPSQSPLPLNQETVNAVAVQKLKIRQVGGSGNALGFVKFLFPNPYNVYMHDTPHTHLFAHSRRAYSHGCIRLEHPRDLATHILGPQGWTSEKVYATAAGHHRESVGVDRKAPVNVYVTYLTAAPGPAAAGAPAATFHPDIYDRDPALIAALNEYGAIW